MTSLSEIFASLDTDPSAPVAAPVASHIGHDHADASSFDAVTARKFITAGNATFTMTSKKTGVRFTYRVRASEDGRVHFVSLMNGPDNETAYAYFGYIRGGVFFHGGKKAKVGELAPSVAGFKWIWANLAKGIMPDTAEIWHAGKCGRCARKLTVPESIASGYGPECINHV